MTRIEACFAIDYADARRRFLQRAAAAGFELHSHLHPTRRVAGR